MLTATAPAGAGGDDKKDKKDDGGGDSKKDAKKEKKKKKAKKESSSESESDDGSSSDEEKSAGELNRQDSDDGPTFGVHEYRLPAPSASISKVGKWLKKMGFGHHVKDAKKNRIDGWALRYLQDVSRRASPQEYSQYARQHFPKMTIGEISSLGGRLLYKAGVTEWV